MTDHRPMLLAERCSTCVFRPGNPMHLQPGRLQELVADNRARGTLLTCHATLPYGEHPEHGEAMCRGYFDAHAAESNTARVMERLQALAGSTEPWYREVPPPT